MADNKNTTPLSEMMNKDPRMGISFESDSQNQDVTPIIVNGTENTTTSEDIRADKPNVLHEAKVVQTGPVDFSSIKPIDVNAILPPRDKGPSEVESKAMSALDMAVNREMESITERIEAIKEKQEEEREAQELQGISDVNNKVETSTEDNDDSYGLYDDEDDSMDTNGSKLVVDANLTPSFRYGIVQNADEHSINVNDDTTIIEPKDDDPMFPKLAMREAKHNVEIDSEFNIDDDDGVHTDDDDDKIVNDMLEDIKIQMKERVAPIKNKIDLSKFTVSKKAISMQKVMKNNAIKSHQNAADWVLYSEERPIAMIGLSGQEIVKLNPENSNRNRLNTFREIYKIIYDHIEDANKPSYEIWLKKTRFIDIQHIYFALYMATFGSSNYTNYICPNSKCNKAFIKNIKLEDMVEYKNDKVKEKVTQILRKDTTSPSSDKYNVDLVQITDNYVFGLHMPSIWNVIMETASLTENFLNNYADLIDMISFIDSIYVIDDTKNILVPIDTKPDPTDQSKSTARRIRAFYDIIRTLSTEEFYTLRSAITKYESSADDIIYKIPKCTCPHCLTEIPENKDITPDQMLFTRHRLVAISSI